MNGPGYGFTVWNSYLRFEYNINASIVSPNYQPVIIGKIIIIYIYKAISFVFNSLFIKGYQTENAATHKSSVSFTNQITDFLIGKFCCSLKNNNYYFILGINKAQTYFLSSKPLSTCETWYWQSYTDILFQRSVNLTYDR
jgi:hypothetical protein